MRCKIYVNIIIKVNNKNQNCSNGVKVANNNKLWNKKNNYIVWLCLYKTIYNYLQVQEYFRKYYKMNKIILQVYNTYIKRQFKKNITILQNFLQKLLQFYFSCSIIVNVRYISTLQK